jgi:hypothetical protein
MRVSLAPPGPVFAILIVKLITKNGLLCKVKTLIRLDKCLRDY